MNNVMLVLVPVAGYFAGAIPFSNIVAKVTAGVDLRQVGTGTVTPRNLSQAAGVWPAVVAGFFEVSKGLVGPMLAGRGHLLLGALAGALAVTGHNWSPFLRGGGGRGLSTLTGAMFVLAWPGAATLCAGLAAGVLTRRVGQAMSAAVVAMLGVLWAVGGWRTAVAGLILLAPMGVKSVLLVRKRGGRWWPARRRAQAQ